jgi:hypothetical protein
MDFILHVAGQGDLAGFDHQHIGTFGDLLRWQVEGAGDVGDHAARVSPG